MGGAEENALSSSSNYSEQPLALLLITTSALTRIALPSAYAASREWQVADALTQSGSATLVSQQQQQQQHRLAAAYTAYYSFLSYSFRLPPAATSSSLTATQDIHLLGPKTQ